MISGANNEHMSLYTFRQCDSTNFTRSGLYPAPGFFIDYFWFNCYYFDMKILFSGGGTLGSVSPLIAIFQEIQSRYDDSEFVWIGTNFGPEYELVKNYQIPYHPISSGKLRRYFSWKNLYDPWKIFAGFIQSYFLLRKEKPDVIITAGGFVAVPVVWAGWLLKIPCSVHQQDVRVGLANKLMGPFVKVITYSFSKNTGYWPEKKSYLVGNPVRSDIISGSRANAVKNFQLDPSLPIVLIIGGGTGAVMINQLTYDSLEELLEFCQVIHITGRYKMEKIAEHTKYRAFEFLSDGLNDVYSAADFVVCRGGMSTLTELAMLHKPTIIIPIPGTHQVDNAIEFLKNNSAIVLDQNAINAKQFVAKIKDTLNDPSAIQNLSRNIGKMFSSDTTKKLVDIILEHVKK